MKRMQETNLPGGVIVAAIWWLVLALVMVL